MAIQIRISPDELLAIASRQQNLAEVIADTVGVLDALKAQMGEAWEGAAANQTLKTIDTLRDNTKEIASVMQENISKLRSVIKAFEAIDSGEQPTIVPFIQEWIGRYRLLGTVLPGLVFNFNGRVRIIPEQVQTVAARLSQLAESIEGNAAAYSDSLKDLSACWEGRSFTKYYEESQEIITRLADLKEGLQDVSARLRRTAARYEEIDNLF